ncbi:RimK family protein [Blastopirellula marina]|uniref:Glutathione synthase/ribosomal protein S6 modification enzyme (Glutaminyl transferase) n=1 Tax=Blastopirellula marina DSM 3645 TaxID=314230 RepID=A3ZWT7_9BACT|nr:RimK family protein [Blastopirellula marina]EAQ79061.1 glutathione synthase/ribosomal protein S6 modification enzyme (glutaminyl transferase) [Blastopirellula marina DSM 3645]
MSVLIVTNTPDDWPAQIENVQVVAANDYLTDTKFSELRGVKVFNLCRSYKYQTIGYYVSLLAEARGHKPLPSVTAVQDLKTHAIVRLASSDLEKLIEKSLAPIKSDKFELSIYFGRNMAQRYDRLCTQLFNQFQTPLLRASFARDKNGWQLKAINAISTNDVPDPHWDFVLEAAQHHFAGRGGSFKKRARARFDMAILHNPDDADKPSNEKALAKFIKAAEAQGIHAEMITRDDYGSIGEFDALFIRETTQVNHHTYRFSRRAAGEGLVVIDDPQSIVRCTNKVFLAEILARHKVATPKTLVVQAETADQIAPQLGFPCVLKEPDSAFSRGVVKVKNEAELGAKLKEFFEHSDLIIAQEFLPTTFDWRIGIIDRQPIYAAKYFMATGHWQIIQQKEGKTRYGKSETIPIELAPRKAVQVALKAANLIGDGLYGVDVKESNGNFSVIEVNDNPNLDAGYEDAILKDELYRRIISVFLRRIEQRKAGLS